MTVEDNADQIDTSTAAPAAAVIETNTGQVDDTAAMDAVWDRLVTNNGAERENGKFVSPDPEKRAAAAAAQTETPSPGGEGEEQAEASTVSTDVPLPANWLGKDALWAKLPADVKTEIAEHQTAQHAKLSDYGRKVAQYEPLQQAASEFAEYFNGTLKDKDGQRIAPADGIRYLANIQRMMDKDPVNTALSIIDTYQLRDKIAAALGVKAGEAGADPAAAGNAALLAEIADLKRTIASNRFDPRIVEQVVDQKAAKAEHDREVSRLTDPKARPLYSKIPEGRMVFFINEAWDKLGQDATKEQVFDHAYKAAIDADPALRAQSQAAATAAEDTAAKAGAAKRGTAVNIRSTGNAKPRPLTDDEAMEETWAKLHA